MKTQADLDKHIEEKHNLTPFSTYLKEIVYGGNDGIITTFAVVAGFAGAQASSSLNSLPVTAVLLFGLANLFADAASMALGNFLSIRAEQDVYQSEKAVEMHEIKHSPHTELQETVLLLHQKGYSKKDATTMAKLYAKNPAYWTEFMMRDELSMQNPEDDNPVLSSLSTFVSFIFFGFIPLIPYVFLSSGNQFFLSISFTALALLSLGFMRYKVTKIKLLRSVTEVLLLGGIAAAIAYFVGTLFRI